MQISALALDAGPAKEPILVLATGAAAARIFFSAASLPTLLIITPVAVVGPLWALNSDPKTESLGHLSLAGLSLAMALSLILNRLLRRQFALAKEREALIGDRDRSLDEATRLAKSKSDLIATLSHEIRNGLSVVTHVLAATAGAGGRSAPSREQIVAALAASQDLHRRCQRDPGQRNGRGRPTESRSGGVRSGRPGAGNRPPPSPSGGGQGTGAVGARR